MKRIRVVAALLPDPNDGTRFLVQQRLPNASRANLWEFPGGKVEPGETDARALVRECREELEVEVAVDEPAIWSTEHAYTDLVVELFLLRCRLVSGTPKCLGAQAIAFKTPNEMKAVPFCEADLPLLDALAAGQVK